MHSTNFSVHNLNFPQNKRSNTLSIVFTAAPMCIEKCSPLIASDGYITACNWPFQHLNSTFSVKCHWLSPRMQDLQQETNGMKMVKLS
jgi:hypothetical protein